MNRSSLTLRFLPALAVLALAACTKQPDKPAAGSATAIQSVDQRVSYGMGYNLGKNLAQEKVLQVDRAAIVAGIEDSMNGVKTRVPEADLNAAFAAIKQRTAAAAAAEGERQLTAGREYLTKNKAKSGVKVTVSGLQYEVLKKGTGPKPTATSTVRVHYHGTLIDGTVFDSSVQRGQPISFPLNGVIPGWTEALQQMSVGEKWRITLPANLGYGVHGKGAIPPNAVLIFEVELLAIQ